MKNKILSLNTKAAIAVGITLLLLIINASGIVTITDTTITTTGDKIKLNFTDGWIYAQNMTLVSNPTDADLATYGALWNSTRSVVLAKSSTWNTTSSNLVSYGTGWNTTKTNLVTYGAGWNSSNNTKIRNSNGKSWTATGANIQLAWSDLTTGGTVWLPAGTFYITSPLTPVNFTRLIGCGEKTVIKLGAGFAGGGFGILNGYRTFLYNNITLSDMTLDGNNTEQGTQWQVASDITLKNLYYKNMNGNAIYCCEGSKRFIIDNIRIDRTTTYQGIALDNFEDSIINNIIIRNSTGAGAQAMAMNELTNVSISNILVSDTSLGIKLVDNSYKVSFNNIHVNNVRGEGFKIQDAKEVVVNNVQINDTSENAFVIDGGASYVDVNNVAIDTVSGAYMGLKLDVVSHINLNNIHIENIGGMGLSIATSNNITINNCDVYITGNYNNMGSCKDVTISNSRFSESATYGININDCSRFTFDTCTILSAASAAIVTGINTLCSYYKIVNCNFINNADIGVWIYKVDNNFMVSNCFFKSNTGDGIDTVTAGANNYTIADCIFNSNAKAIDLNATDNYFTIHGCICGTGDIIDLSGSVDNATAYCNKFDNVASITWT